MTATAVRTDTDTVRVQPAPADVLLRWDGTGQYLVVSRDVNLAFLGVDDAARSFRPGTALSFEGGPAAGSRLVVTDPAEVWPLDTVNTYGETRAAAVARLRAAVLTAERAVADCGEGCEGHEDVTDALQALGSITLGRRDDYSLDGIDAESWTIRADLGCEAASRAEHDACHN